MSKRARSPLADQSYKADPYAFYAQIRRDTPAYRTRLPNGAEVYLVTRYEDVQAGLKDGRLVKNIHNARPPRLIDKLGFTQLMNNSSMLKADPPEHTRLRALAHAAFTPRFVQQLRGHIQQIADALIDAVPPHGPMDLINDFAFPLPITVICEMLGVPTQDDRKFRQWSGALIASGVISSETPHIVPEFLPLAHYLSGLIAQRRKAPKDDLISQLIHSEQDGDRLSANELLGTTLVLLIAGHETTVNLIGSGMFALLQAPEQLQKLKDDPALIKPAVEELLRFVNPVQAVNRYAAEDLEIGGVAILKGSHLMFVVAAADHDPDYIANPEQLDVTRGDTKHVAFGQGIHYCLGAPLARLEGEIAFATLLKGLPNLRLAIDPRAVEWRAAFELRGLSALPVEF
jgi:cytochrome P450